MAYGRDNDFYSLRKQFDRGYDNETSKEHSYGSISFTRVLQPNLRLSQKHRIRKVIREQMLTRVSQ